jgi:hypothetical protein
LAAGPASEALFDHECAVRGINPCRPLVDRGYDRIVEHSGLVRRVQIKSTRIVRRGCWRVKTTNGAGGAYGHNDFDVLAIYLAPIDTWVIMPRYEIVGAQFEFVLNGKFEKYVNNWDLLYGIEEENKG